ncbi:MAG TPA: hypothetical protein VF472_23350 [Burkholderiaceae bacterium]
MFAAAVAGRLAVSPVTVAFCGYHVSGIPACFLALFLVSKGAGGRAQAETCLPDTMVCRAAKDVLPLE